MTVIDNQDVAEVFNTYPKPMRHKVMALRRLILATAADTDGVGDVVETLKWGEPSYLTKGGSTIRLAWKESRPDHYAMYFICTSKLVDTFREIYENKFEFEGNRAIVFQASAPLPVDELKHCIALALTYHTRKHLPKLGA